MVTKALLFMTNMKYLASDVVSRLETMLETLIPVKTGLQIITGCLKKHIHNWSISTSLYHVSKHAISECQWSTHSQLLFFCLFTLMQMFKAKS